ncbi:hypothetical protein DRQ20_03505 [bacterium]|nr:MAG: hypothetical protein DRQ18_06880 [bacterium]RKZ26195.1 MAG: hypothetical protein DRQ20_03505 [bacterium]
MLWLLLFAVEDRAVVEFEVEPTISLEVLTKFVDFGEIDPGKDVEKRGAIRLRVKANTDWVLSFKVPEEFRDETGKIIPLDIMEWKLPDGEYRPLRKDENFDIAKGGPTEEKLITLDLKIRVGWEIGAGRFTVPFIFVLRAND